MLRSLAEKGVTRGRAIVPFLLMLETVVARCRRQRIINLIPLREIAEIANTSPSHVWAFENGKSSNAEILLAYLVRFPQLFEVLKNDITRNSEYGNG